VSITIVIVFSTTNPTKLSLHLSEFLRFSTHFTSFSNKSYTIEDALLRLEPWNFLQSHNNTPTSHKTPREENWGRNWVPGHGGDAAQPISARPAVFPAGQGRGEESKLTKGPLELRTWAGRRLTAAHGSDRRGRLRWPQLRRVQCTGSTTRDVRGTRRFYGWRPNDLVARTARTSARRRRRPWRATRRGWAARPGAHRGGQPP
jgi:hypothetical protein